MRRLSAVLLYACCTLLVLFALLVSGLRVVMPYMDHYRNDIAAFLSSLTGCRIKLQHIKAQWLGSGPSINISGLSIENQKIAIQVHRLDLALNIWQSLFSSRWQFEELTFSQLYVQKFSSATSFSSGLFTQSDGGLEQLLLHRVDHFSLQDSEISFVSSSGQAVALHIPALTWYNEIHRHRAEGEISLDSFSEQHGSAMLRLDLRDHRQQLDNGKIWIQAKNIDLKPWVGQWMPNPTNIKQAQFNLTSWISLQSGQISSGDILLDKGHLQWLGDDDSHQFEIEQLNGHLQRQHQGWTFTIRQPQLATDGLAWPKGNLQFYWQPAQQHWLMPSLQSEIRFRGHNLELARVTPLLSLISQLPTDFQHNLTHSTISGLVDKLSLDIPLSSPEKSRLQLSVRNLTSQGLPKMPGFKQVDAVIGGSLLAGEARIHAAGQRIDAMGQLQAPIELENLQATLGWNRANGLSIYGKNLALSAQSLSASGDFRYQQLPAKPPQLDITASINTSNAADAWRYLPVRHMPASLVSYLSSAIKGGQVQGANLTFSGDPHQFPFRQHQGVFQIQVPLRHAFFAFQPAWPTLNDFSIDLNFLNNGLWIKSPQLLLGKAIASDVKADIPDYRQQQLLISGNIQGLGQQVSEYFADTPLKASVGSALQQLVVEGPINGDLALNIPLNGHPVKASGKVNFSDNHLFIKPLAIRISGLTGSFSYDNGQLLSNDFQGKWYDQPVTFTFNTEQQTRNYIINTRLKSEWNPTTLTFLPAKWRSLLAGRLPLQASASIHLQQGKVSYNAGIDSDLGGVSGRLPELLVNCCSDTMAAHASVTGDLQQFVIKGTVAKDQQFISRWDIRHGIHLERGTWSAVSEHPQSLPLSSQLLFVLPELNGDQLATKINKLLALIESDTVAQQPIDHSVSGQNKDLRSLLPGKLQVTTPSLYLAGQYWKNLSVKLNSNWFSELMLRLDGDEIHGGVQIRARQPWQVHLDYLYYNPQWHSQQSEALFRSDNPPAVSFHTFTDWPDINTVCQNCWLWGQQVGRIASQLTIKTPSWLQVKSDIVNGKSHLSLTGDWNNVPGKQRTALQGQFYSDDFYQASQRFGYTSPIRALPFDLHYDLHWHNPPWQPDIARLSGLLKLKVGKGQIDNVSTGRTAQILRLFSLDALLSRVKLDFIDTFKNSFYFSSIDASAWIEQGVINTDNLRIDGLEADIDITGKVDLNSQKLALRAKVVPEIAAPVGVAAAFTINPIVGAVVFAASKVLSPWWSKISLLNYDISGSLDKPLINKVPAKAIYTSK